MNPYRVRRLGNLSAFPEHAIRKSRGKLDDLDQGIEC